MFALLTALLGALPLDGHLIREDRACYAIFQGSGPAETPVGETLQTIVKGRVAGRDVLRVTVHQRVGGGRFDMRDEVVLDGATMRPLSLTSTRNGKPHASLAYEEDRVRGEKHGRDGAAIMIDAPLLEPVAEGNLYGVNFAALPLKEGATFRLPFYQYDKGVGAFSIVVVGRETVSTSEGPTEAWVLDAGPSPQERLTYLVALKDRRELGYRGAKGSQRLGGDCSGLD